MKSHFALCIVFLVIVGCQSHQSLTSREIVEETKPSPSDGSVANWRSALGTWYGNQPGKDGKRFEWIIRRSANGVYEFISRLYEKDGTHDEVTEYGGWYISGPIYFLVARASIEKGNIKTIHSYGPDLGSAYKILIANEREFVIKAYSDGSVFRVIKVKDDFTFEDASSPDGTESQIAE